METDLFETLRTELGLPYISDLPYASERAPEAVARALLLVDAQRFPVDQWEDLYIYLLGQRCPAGASAAKAQAELAVALEEAVRCRR